MVFSILARRTGPRCLRMNRPGQSRLRTQRQRDSADRLRIRGVARAGDAPANCLLTFNDEHRHPVSELCRTAEQRFKNVRLRLLVLDIGYGPLDGAGLGDGYRRKSGA